ncbi:MAG: DUF4838 domain-containing protein [Spirochaetaceae bacterium]|nr:DUF4838 domain-containing protein [Spirochaetaceae bacterium]
MEIDLSRRWSILLADASSPNGTLPPEEMEAVLAEPSAAPDPARFAAAELAAFFARVGGKPVHAGRGDEGPEAGLLILDPGAGSGPPASARRGYAWRASAARIELTGDSPAGLLAAVYDFLGHAGARWTAPGSEGERLPAVGAGAGLPLAAAGGRSKGPKLNPVLILGHGSYLERAEEYFLWAARNGYVGVFMHTIEGPFALGACPARRYESLRPRLAALAARLGLSIEEGGHLLSGFLPRRLFRARPELFRMTEGKRRADRNFCPSNPAALALVAENFAAFARSRPEVAVFHVWPDDLPGGGWCACPDCAGALSGAGLSPAAQSLTAALALAAALKEVRPEAKLSFLAYHDTEEAAAAARTLAPAGLPPNLELLWAPRRRNWARGYAEAGDADSGATLNAASRASFESARPAFRAGGAAVFEYYEDALLWKGAVPPLAATMAADLAYYAGAGAGPAAGAGSVAGSEAGAEAASKPLATKVGILLTGDRLPLAARPNVWLFPRLAWSGGGDPEPLLRDWTAATFGPAAPAMAAYWRALAEAWSLNLDLVPGETENRIPAPLGQGVAKPPADWGDPWLADRDRLAERRGRAEELFDRLREAEAALDKAAELLESAAKDDAGAADPGRLARCAAALADEDAEYGIAAAVLELDCARIAAYHELASGELAAAADIALLARSALSGLYRAARIVPDRRSRRNLRFLGFFYYDLRLRAIRREAARPLARAAGAAAALAELYLRGLGLFRLWDRAPERRPGRVPERR